MDVRLLWAGVWFTAQNGDAESLLSEAARAGLHLSAVSPAPGGFSGRCAAWQYRNLAALARKRRVRLRIQTRTGLYFRLRPFLRRRGLWWVFYCSFPCWSGHRILSGPWMQAA